MRSWALRLGLIGVVWAVLVPFLPGKPLDFSPVDSITGNTSSSCGNTFDLGTVQLTGLSSVEVQFHLAFSGTTVALGRFEGSNGALGSQHAWQSQGDTSSAFIPGNEGAIADGTIINIAPGSTGSVRYYLREPADYSGCFRVDNVRFLRNFYTNGEGTGGGGGGITTPAPTATPAPGAPTPVPTPTAPPCAFLAGFDPDTCGPPAGFCYVQFGVPGSEVSLPILYPCDALPTPAPTPTPATPPDVLWECSLALANGAVYCFDDDPVVTIPANAGGITYGIKAEWQTGTSGHATGALVLQIVDPDSHEIQANFTNGGCHNDGFLSSCHQTSDVLTPCNGCPVTFKCVATFIGQEYWEGVSCQVLKVWIVAMQGGTETAGQVDGTGNVPTAAPPTPCPPVAG